MGHSIWCYLHVFINLILIKKKKFYLFIYLLFFGGGRKKTGFLGGKQRNHISDNQGDFQICSPKHGQIGLIFREPSSESGRVGNSETQAYNVSISRPRNNPRHPQQLPWWPVLLLWCPSQSSQYKFS